MDDGMEQFAAKMTALIEQHLAVTHASFERLRVITEKTFDRMVHLIEALPTDAFAKPGQPSRVIQ
jgi:hypothetical protein